MGKVMVVTGAFATHTTKLYHYYVCPVSWDIKDVDYIAVNYINELKYLGKVTGKPVQCNFGMDDKIELPKGIPYEIKVDLNEFKCKLNHGDFYLFILDPILGGCRYSNLKYEGKGAFVSNIQCNIFFPNLAEFFKEHQNLNS